MIRIPTISVKHNWRKARTRNGLFPIHISVYLPGEKARYYPVKLPKKVSYEDWSGEHNHWVKPTHIFYFEINCKIAETSRVVGGHFFDFSSWQTDFGGDA